MRETNEVSISSDSENIDRSRNLNPLALRARLNDGDSERASLAAPSHRLQLLRALVCIAAAYLAFVGQGLLTGFLLDPQWAKHFQATGRTDVGLALSLVAALAFGVAAPRLSGSSTTTATGGDHRAPFVVGGSRSLRTLACIFLAMSLGLCWYANALHLRTYDQPTLPAKYPWWISIAAFCCALEVVRRLEKKSARGESSPLFTKWNYLCLTVITCGAAAVRLYDIVDTPVAVNMDNTGAMLAAQERSNPLFWLIPGLGIYGIPAVALVFLKISVWFNAPDIFGLRLPEAVLGTLMVFGSYLLVWRSFDSHRLAALSAALLAVNAGHIHFSRHIMNLDPWTFVVFGFLLLVHGIRSQRAWAIGAAGIVLAFSLHLYLAVRVLIFVAPLFALYLWRNHRAAIRQLYDGWLLFACGALVMVGPNVADMMIWQGPWELSNRTGTSFLTVQTLYDASKAHNLPTVMSFVEFQLRRILLIPQVLPDTSGQITSAAPMFDLLIAPFFWLGFGSAVVSWRTNPAMVLNLLVCAMTLALGQAVFNNVPYWPRLIFLMFAGSLWIAIGILGFCQSCATVAAWSMKRCGNVHASLRMVVAPVTGVTLAALVLLVGQRQWSAYALSARRDASQLELAGRFIYRLPPNAVACGARSAFDTYVGRSEMPFFAQGRTLKELGPRPAQEIADQCGPRPFGWIVMPDQSALKDRLVALYPDGELKTYHHKYGQHLLWTFYVP
jgi:hypothetical protein